MAAAKPFVVNGDLPLSEGNPHTWLVLSGDPPGSPGPRCMVGTLRPEHRGRANSAAAFAAAKLLIEVSETDQSWRSEAYRHEVILPHGADDRLSCPRTLFGDIDSAHVPGGKALLTYITLTWTPTRLHHGWRVAHHLAADLVETFSVPALIIQHVPGLVANTATPHCHLLVGSRSLSGIGWGGYVAALNGDRAWPLIRAKFDALLTTIGMVAGTVVTARPDDAVGASRPGDTEGVAFDASR
jgi:hypothetical protein